MGLETGGIFYEGPYRSSFCTGNRRACIGSDKVDHDNHNVERTGAENDNFGIFNFGAHLHRTHDGAPS